MLTTEQIEKSFEKVYKKYKDQGITSKDNLLLIKDFLDEVMNELNSMDRREGKKIKNEDEYIENQIKMVRAVRMNNPLWD